MNISNKIIPYEFKNSNFTYTINNYDYFTTDYNISSNSIKTEILEYTTMIKIVNSLDKSKSIIDIGANCGLFSVPVSLLGYTTYSFEPISLNVKLLELNKETNNCELMNIVNKGLFSEITSKKIYIPYCSDNTSFDKEVAISNMKSKDYLEEIVQCITFDSWIKINSGVNPGFIKIDVQGYEQQVLEGMTEFMSNCSDVHIFIEWDKNHTEKAGNTLEKVNELLTTNGFTEIQNYGNDKHFYKQKR